MGSLRFDNGKSSAFRAHTAAMSKQYNYQFFDLESDNNYIINSDNYSTLPLAEGFAI